MVFERRSGLLPDVWPASRSPGHRFSWAAFVCLSDPGRASVRAYIGQAAEAEQLRQRVGDAVRGDGVFEVGCVADQWPNPDPLRIQPGWPGKPRNVPTGRVEPTEWASCGSASASTAGWPTARSAARIPWNRAVVVPAHTQARPSLVGMTPAVTPDR